MKKLIFFLISLISSNLFSLIIYDQSPDPIDRIYVKFSNNTEVEITKQFEQIIIPEFNDGSKIILLIVVTKSEAVYYFDFSKENHDIFVFE